PPSSRPRRATASARRPPTPSRRSPAPAGRAVTPSARTAAAGADARTPRGAPAARRRRQPRGGAATRRGARRPAGTGRARRTGRRPRAASAPPASLDHSATQEHGGDGADEDAHVRWHGPRRDVLEVDPGALRIGDEAPPRHLPRTRQPRSHAQEETAVVAVLPHLVGHDGPWTDEAHVAAEHVPQLGQLVDARTAQKPAEAR